MADNGFRSPKDGISPNGLDSDGKPRLTEEEKKQNHIASGKRLNISDVRHDC
jgi:hypothetical protein